MAAYNLTEEQIIDAIDWCPHKLFILRTVGKGDAKREISPVLVLANEVITDDTDHCTQVFRNRLQFDCFIDQLQSVANELWPQETAS
ncbi:hypothetical protein UFOVP383_40 [uncultured Caudovirales phage]|uniref:Uncharacterized protein n=1 Tax=uncultured Caudovirales phage TaxID=2100421 RepID=A0A6J7X2Q5_9CAUD|nr:hypothetical protein UFOVP383_40 [uncultured Caudovirales phage]